MYNDIHKKSNNRWISLILCISIFIGELRLPVPEKLLAADSNEIWASVSLKEGDNEFNESQETVKISKDKIIQEGTHNTATNGDRYATKDYYYVTTKKYDLDKLFTEDANASIKTSILANTHSSEPQGDGTTISTYVMKRRDFMKAVTDLGVTATDLINAPATGFPVYLNTIYEVYVDYHLKENFVYGCQEMLDAGVKYFGASGWSTKTQKRIKDYYNYEYTLNASNTYDVKIVAVDGNENVLKTFTLTDKQKYGMYSQAYTYTLPIKILDIAGKGQYTFQNMWKYSYIDRSTNANAGAGYTATTGTIKFDSMPDVKNVLTIKFLFKPKTKPSIPPTPMPENQEIIVPEYDDAYLEFTDVVNTGQIRADLRGTEKFVAPLGVPTTESMFGEVTAKEYLLGYSFIKRVGIEYFPITVTKNYILTWETATPEEAGGGETETQTVPVSKIVMVPRAYGYWEITNLECFKIDNAVLRNYSLPNGATTIYPNYSYYSPPYVSFYHSDSKTYHIIPPDNIVLPDEVIAADAENPIKKPIVKTEDFTAIALAQTGNAKVRSDSLVFNGSMVIDSSIVETEAPNINEAAIPQCDTFISNNVLYKNNLIIDAVKKNGTYPSSGTITYTEIARVNASRPNNPQYIIDGINTVVIHTPVVCNPSITADNDKYVQLINPTKGYVQLVLDPDPTLSDFTVNISNTGFHTGKQGYFTRDFSYSLRDSSLSYIASKSGLLRNEVKFPFDVYIDVGSDNDQTNDDYIKAGTWVTIGRASPRFYLPAWDTEGTYAVDFRTVAVNGEDSIEKTENFANTSLVNYIATKSINVEVSGRIYGLTVYDITDYPIWEETFRVPKSTDFKKDFPSYLDGTNKANYNKQYAYTYSVGTNDQYGNDTGRNIKYTFPLVNGSHPFYKNQGILKTGYMVRFSLDTVGTMFSDACSVTLKPNFYFVDKNGENRAAVDLYYTEEINGKSKHLVKVGGALDKTNIKKVMTGDLNLGIPVAELKQTSALRGEKYGNFIAGREAMFTFSNIRLNYAFRTYVGNNYLASVKDLDSYGDVISSGISQDDATMAIQRWYGQYYIPNEAHAVAKGYDVMDYADKYGVDYDEDFWLTDGYIIVNFTIETVDESGQRRLSYINATNYRDKGNCSMWITEAPALSKESYKGPKFYFYAGDFMVYYANKKMSDDYTSGSIY